MNVVPHQTPEVPCAECGRLFPASDVILLNSLRVCGGCKSLFLQQLREGVIPVDTTANLWRVKKHLVTNKGTPFPDRCVRCNAPANGYRLKLVSVHIAFFACRKTVLHVGLCEKHRLRRKWVDVISFFSIIGGLALITSSFGFWPQRGWMVLTGVVVFLGGAICGAINSGRISMSKIDNDKVWVTGVNKDFLAQLPEWNG